MGRKEITAFVKRETMMVVQSGPFAGLKMLDIQTWGHGDDIGPQLLGVYEAELHSVIDTFVARAPSTIINIGCAEGYYAVGLARLLPRVRVLAFDTDPKAQEVCRNNAILNGVADRVFVDGECSLPRIQEISAEDRNILALVDCEGAEAELFGTRDAFLPLLYANLVIETHGVGVEDTLPTLVQAACGTHRLQTVQSGSRNPHAFAFLDECADADKWLLVCENRPSLQNWLVCQHRKAQPPIWLGRATR